MFLSCTTVPANWGAVFDLEIPSWLLLDGKLCVILFNVGDSVCLSLRCETDWVFSSIVLVGRPLKAKGSGNISLLDLSLYFAVVQWFLYFF